MKVDSHHKIRYFDKTAHQANSVYELSVDPTIYAYGNIFKARNIICLFLTLIEASILSSTQELPLSHFGS